METVAIALAGLLFSSPVAAAAPADSNCDLPAVEWMGELQLVLGRRAVEVVNKAADLQAGTDVQLAQLIEPTAKFSLGAGDVGRPLGTGVAGARALAREMKADTYRFFGWNSIPSRVDDLCGTQKVTVEFTDTDASLVYPVVFTFSKGRVVAAEGWTLYVQAGRLGAASQ